MSPLDAAHFVLRRYRRSGLGVAGKVGAVDEALARNRLLLRDGPGAAHVYSIVT